MEIMCLANADNRGTNRAMIISNEAEATAKNYIKLYIKIILKKN